MSIEKVKDYFRQYGMEGRGLEVPVSSATGGLARKALGWEPGRVAKTISSMGGGRSGATVAAGRGEGGRDME